MIDVAAAAGVSQTAVSLALTDHPRISIALRKRIKRISRRLHYEPPAGTRSLGARLHRAKPLKHIGVVFVGSPMPSPLLPHISSACLAAGIRLEVIVTPPDWAISQRQSHILGAAQNLDGLVLTDLVDFALLSALAAQSICYVVLGHVLPAENVSDPTLMRAVTADEIAMGREAVAWLVRRGHRKVALVSGQTIPGLYFGRWRDGFRLGHHDIGLPTGTELEFAFDCPEETQIQQLAAMLKCAGAPTRFVCTHTSFAQRLMAAAMETGISIPREAVLIGDLAEQIASYGFARHPALMPDGPTMVRIALQLLERQRAGEKTLFGEWIIPHLRHNISLPRPDGNTTAKE